MNIKERDHRSTPQHVLDYITRNFGTYFDPCPLHSRHDCFSRSFNWPDKKETPIFINPPFSELKRWVILASDLFERAKYKNVIVLCGIQRKTMSSLYFRDRVYGKAEMRVLPGNLCFGDHKTPANFSTCLLVFGPGEPGTIKYVYELDPNIHFYAPVP